MSFSPYERKEVQEMFMKKVFVSNKNSRKAYPPIHFNNVTALSISCQKHWDMHLDDKRNLNYCIKEKRSKANKIYIGVMKMFYEHAL